VFVEKGEKAKCFAGLTSQRYLKSLVDAVECVSGRMSSSLSRIMTGCCSIIKKRTKPEDGVEDMFEVTEKGSEIIKIYLDQKKWPGAVRILPKAG
jgi:DNA-binding HxlR family transcriptional regulator